MSMQAESLEVLESANVAPPQARAIVRAIEIELAGAPNEREHMICWLACGASLTLRQAVPRNSRIVFSITTLNCRPSVAASL